MKIRKGQKAKSNLFVCKEGHLHMYESGCVIKGLYGNCHIYDSFWKMDLPMYEYATSPEQKRKNQFYN